MSANLARLKKRAAELEQKKQFDKALEVYIQILEEGGKELADDDVPLFNRVGDMLMRKGNMSEALSYYERAVDVYAERGFLNNAIALCSKILRQSPGRAAVYYKLGRISARKGFKSDARKNFLEYADRMQKAGKSDEAFRALKEFASLYPDQDDVRLILAELLSKENRKGEALEQLQALYDKLEAEGRRAEARATVDRMKAIDPMVEPRVTGTQAVQQSADLVFLDLTDEEPRRSSTPAPTKATPRASPPPLAAPVPALDGLTLTFVPDDSEPPPPVGRPDGFEQTSVDEPAGAERADDEGPGVGAPEPIELEPVMEAIGDLGVIEPLADLEATALDEPLSGVLLPDESVEEALDEAPLAEIELEERVPVDEAIETVDLELAGGDAEPIDLDEAGAVPVLADLDEPSDVESLPETDADLPLEESVVEDELEVPDEEAVEVPAPDAGPGMDLPVLAVEDAGGRSSEDVVDAPVELEPVGASGEMPEDDGTVEPDDDEDAREAAPLSETEFAVLALPDVHRPTPVRVHDLALPGHLPGTPQFVRVVSATPTSSAAGEDARNAAEEEADLMADLAEREALHRTQPPREAWSPRPAVPDESDVIEAGDEEGEDSFFGAADPAPNQVAEEYEPDGVPDDFLSVPPSFGAVDEAHEPAFPPLPGLENPSAAEAEEHAAEWANPLAQGEGAEAEVEAEPVSSGASRSPRSTLSIGSAEDHLRQRLELEPENWQLRRMLAEAMLDTGNRDGGLYELELTMVGFELDGDIDRATEVVDEILGLLPGSVRHHQKRVEYAVRARDRQRLIHAYLELADALFRTGTADKAVSVYSRVLELDGSNDRAEFALATLAPEQLVRIRGGAVRPERWSDELAAITDPSILVTPPPRAEADVPDESPPRLPDDEEAGEEAEAVASDAIEPDMAPAGPGVGDEPPVSGDDMDASPAADLDAAVSDGPEPDAVDEPVALEPSADPLDEPAPAPASVPDESEAETWVEETVDAAPEPEHEPEPAVAWTESVTQVIEPELEPEREPAIDEEPPGSTSDWDSLIEAGPIEEVSDAPVPPEWDQPIADTEPESKPLEPEPEPALSRLERARRLTPVVVSESDFVDLGEWLRTTEPVRSTRMMVEDPKPTGDEQADFEELLRRFKRGVAENVEAEDYEAHYDLGVAYKEMGLIDEAIAQFQKSLRGSSHRVRSYEALGQCFVEKEQYPIAAALLQRATELPGTDDQQLVGVLYLLGFATEHLGRPADALPYYLRVFAVDIEFRDIGERVAALGNPTK